MGTILKVTANQGKYNDVAVLCWEFQAHVEVVFKQFVIETMIADKRKHSISTNIVFGQHNYQTNQKIERSEVSVSISSSASTILVWNAIVLSNVARSRWSLKTNCDLATEVYA